MKKIAILLLCLFLFLGCASSSSDEETSTPDGDTTTDAGDTPTDAGDTPTDDENTPTDDENTPITGVSGGNNSAVFSGVNIGSGTSNNSVLHKTVPISVETGNGFSVSNAFLTRSSDSSETAYWVADVINNNSTAYCFVRLDTVAFYDDNNNAIESSSSEYVQGSVGEVSSGNWTGTCLAAGESGVVYGIEFSIYSNVSSIVVSSIEFSSSTVSDPTSIIIPQELTVTSEDSFSVSLLNEGSQTADLSFPVYIFKTSSNGDYLHWGFFDPPTDSILTANETVTITESYYRYPGTVSAAIVYSDFGKSSIAKMDSFMKLPASLSRDEKNKFLLDERKRRISQTLPRIQEH